MNSEKLKKRIIVKVVEIFPSEAKCLLNRAFVEAQIAAGKNWQVVLDASEEVLRQTCTHCRQLASQELRSVA